MSKTCYIVVGLPSEHKSAIAANLSISVPNSVIFSPKLQDLLDDSVDDEFRLCITAYDAVIIDYPNLTRDVRKRWIEPAREKGFKIHTIDIETGIQNSVSENADLPEHFVTAMYMSKQSVLVGDETDVLQVMAADPRSL